MTKQRQKHTTIALAIAKLNATQLLTLAATIGDGAASVPGSQDLASALDAFESDAKDALRIAFGVKNGSIHE